MPHVECSRTGTFKAKASSYGLMQGKDGSQSVWVSFNFQLLEYYDENTKTWVPWSEYAESIFGKEIIRKKDGTLFQKGVENLCQVFDWNGNLEDWGKEGVIHMPVVQIVVEEETYKEQTRFVVAWINPLGGGGGNFSNADDRVIAGLQANLGGELRAIAGNVKRNKPKPADPVEATASENPDDDVPF